MKKANKTTVSPKGGNKPKSKFSFQAPKGMHDILPREQNIWNKVMKEAVETAEFYGFQRIDIPTLEEADLFVRSAGADSDMVEKEMFYVRSGGKDRYVLRPEGTASIARAYLEHGLSHIGQPAKLYYTGSMFRHEQPQAGRLREFHQFGFETIGGSADPVYDAQIILVSFRLLEQCKLKGLSVQINSIGCRVCRPHYRKRLLDYYRRHEKELCSDCVRRMKTNPLRLLDCKEQKCQALREKAPSLMDNLCVSCSGHLKLVIEYLDELALPYTLNPYLVRGLDYYNKTVFEIFAEGYNMALVAGGRYDYLFDMIGARPTPAVGSAVGLERVIEVARQREVSFPERERPKVFLMYIGDMAKKKALTLVEQFRVAGVRVREALGKDVLKKQMQLADKENSDFALILGQKEVFEGSIIIRDLKSGNQESIPLDRVLQEVKKRLK